VATAGGGFDDVVSWDVASDAARTSMSGDRFPWTLERCFAGRVVVFSTLNEIPFEAERAAYQSAGVGAGLVFPLTVDGTVVGAAAFFGMRRDEPWGEAVIARLQTLSSVMAQVLARRRRDDALRQAIADIERLRHELEQENVQLRSEARLLLGEPAIIGQSEAVRRVLSQIEQVAATDSTVLLYGETGTGKELFATQIHELGPRRLRAMVRTNCAAIPSTLIESELFGREKGAFTGALSRQIGRFELAHGSTIFLDEIGDLAPEVQVKLLRVLDEGQMERLGSPLPIEVDVRIIVATHRNLEQRVAEGAFRQDLYYRLNVFPIRVPPLRERLEDIPLLAWRFVDEFSKRFGKKIEAILPESLAALGRHSWPGNIRELRNAVERAIITATGPQLTIPVPPASKAALSHSSRLEDVEREHIRRVLEHTGWRVRGPGGAAATLGLKPTTLETRLHKLGLKRPAARPA
jgi:transcriptional regulator with GAF, ATPase, and Fis domain